jgi:excisionase family DNA binding protein
MSTGKEKNMDGWSQEVLLRCDDVAHILKISRSKTYMLIQSGDIMSVRIGSSVRVRPSDLRIFIADRVSGSTRYGQ